MGDGFVEGELFRSSTRIRWHRPKSGEEVGSRDRGRLDCSPEGLRRSCQVTAENPDLCPGRTIGEVVQALHLLGSQ
jgi:hypothetical protein